MRVERLRCGPRVGGLARVSVMRGEMRSLHGSACEVCDDMHGRGRVRVRKATRTQLVQRESGGRILKRDTASCLAGIRNVCHG